MEQLQIRYSYELVPTKDSHIISEPEEVKEQHRKQMNF